VRHDIAGTERTHDQSLEYARRLLNGVQAYQRAGTRRCQADLEPGGAGELGCRLAVQPFGQVPPGVRMGRVVLGDLPVDLGTAVAPPAVLALPLPEALGAVEHLDPLG